MYVCVYVYSVLCGAGQDVKVKVPLRANQEKLGQLANLKILFNIKDLIFAMKVFLFVL